MTGNWAVESMYFEVSRLVWTVFTLLFTLLRLQSSFFFMTWVLFPGLGRMLLTKLYEGETLGKKRKEKDWKWLAIHLSSLFVPLVLSISMTYATFIMFIPIMGRAGSAVNPDLLIGCKAVSMTLATIR